MVVEKAGEGSERIDCVEKNLQTSYRAPPFILFPSDRIRPPHGQHSTRGKGERTRKQ